MYKRTNTRLNLSLFGQGKQRQLGQMPLATYRPTPALSENNVTWVILPVVVLKHVSVPTKMQIYPIIEIYANISKYM